jgi:1-phosphatidylinositol-4-phosphate 5-kinase
MLGSRNSFQFTDYSPKRFAKIRKLSGITTEQYQQSFTSTTMPDFSGGRSGAFAYFSSDYKYIVKTCTAVEMETLLNLLPEYETYLLSVKS